MHLVRHSLTQTVVLAAATRMAIADLGKSSYIAVCTGFWYEWSLAIPAGFGFDFANRTVTLFDEGETRISTSTWPQVRLQSSEHCFDQATDSLPGRPCCRRSSQSAYQA